MKNIIKKHYESPEMEVIKTAVITAFTTSFIDGGIIDGGNDDDYTPGYH